MLSADVGIPAGAPGTRLRHAALYASPVREAGRTLVMGIVNLTPDSFFDGGRLPDPEAARDHALSLVAAGADILDLGAESSRPGADPISAECEAARLLPVLELLQDCPVPLSVDTYHASTALAALALGASMINDISALRGDPAMARVVAEAGCPCVLMHMQGEPRNMQQHPRYEHVVEDICAFFEARIQYALDCGIAREQLWLDPGFGFGKTVAHNLTLLRDLAAFQRFGLPVMIGTSNKSTIGAVLGVEVNDRLEGTAATVSAAILAGAQCIRVHDVRAMARVARMTEAIVKGVY